MTSTIDDEVDSFERCTQVVNYTPNPGLIFSSNVNPNNQVAQNRPSYQTISPLSITPQPLLTPSPHIQQPIQMSSQTHRVLLPSPSTSPFYPQTQTNQPSHLQQQLILQPQSQHQPQPQHQQQIQHQHQHHQQQQHQQHQQTSFNNNITQQQNSSRNVRIVPIVQNQWQQQYPMQQQPSHMQANIQFQQPNKNQPQQQISFNNNITQQQNSSRNVRIVPIVQNQRQQQYPMQQQPSHMQANIQFQQPNKNQPQQQINSTFYPQTQTNQPTILQQQLISQPQTQLQSQSQPELLHQTQPQLLTQPQTQTQQQISFNNNITQQQNSSRNVRIVPTVQNQWQQQPTQQQSSQMQAINNSQFQQPNINQQQQNATQFPSCLMDMLSAIPASNDRSSVSVSSTTIANNVPKTADIEIQVTPDLVNKACQVDCKVEMVHKMLNATVQTCDQETQTINDESKSKQSIKPVMIDRALSPINFSVQLNVSKESGDVESNKPTTLVRRKTTAKRKDRLPDDNNDEKKKQAIRVVPILEDSDSEIDVIE